MSGKEMATHEHRSSAGRDPVRELRTLTGVPDLFEDLLSGFPPLRAPALPRAWTPRVNIKESDKEYVITAALPGVKKEDLKISVEDGMLTITGEHSAEKEEKGKDFLRQEYSCGSFQRSFVLPAGMHPEEVKATQKDGILTVILPKPPQTKSRGVNVKVD